MAAMFAATYPERVSALVLANATARPWWAPDHPWASSPSLAGAHRDRRPDLGEGLTMAAVNPTIAGDEKFVDGVGRFLRSPQVLPSPRPSSG